MNKTDEPKKQAVPFGLHGQREELLLTTPSGDNSASYDLGFPPITMILKAAGGKPPKGQDMNQILYELAAIARWSGAGGSYGFDSSFSNTVAGYPAGARILTSDGSGFWLNTLDANTTHPENDTATLTGWIPDGNFGLTMSTGLSNSNRVLTTLQAAKETLILTGTLTANINLTIPAWVKKWTVFNNCRGEFTVTVKTATGTGVAVTAGSSINLFGDGTDIFSDKRANDSSGSLLAIRTLLNSTQYTPSAGTKKIRVRIQGGGGAGGNTRPTDANDRLAVASGGTAGAYGETTLIDATAIKELPCTVGAGGSSQLPGQSSTFGSYITAPGGWAGYDGREGKNEPLVASGTRPSDLCSGTAVLFSCRGQGGGGPIVVGNPASFAQVRGGDGGASFFGGGGRGQDVNNPQAQPGVAFGSGGSGAVFVGWSSLTTRTGGPGAAGVIIIEEYN